MIAVFGDVLWRVLPVVVVTAALMMGPTHMVMRAVLHRWAGPADARRWYRPATCGLISGAVAAVAITTLRAPDQTIDIALLSLLVLLAAIDWRWRWLPLEWTLAVIALALVRGAQDGLIIQVIIQMALPGLTLLVLRQVLFWRSGQEPLGLGDVWLVAGLGGFLMPFESFAMIGFAAFSGLVALLLRRVLGVAARKSFGVSYGTHLCGVFAVIHYLWRFV